MWHIALRQLARGAPQIVSEARAYQDANREIAALRSPWAACGCSCQSYCNITGSPVINRGVHSPSSDRAVPPDLASDAWMRITQLGQCARWRSEMFGKAIQLACLEHESCGQVGGGNCGGVEGAPLVCHVPA